MFSDQDILDAAEAAEREGDLRQLIAGIFAEFRQNEGWTQREAALYLGTSQQNVPRLEKGRQDLKLSTLQKFAAAYGYGIEINFVPFEEEVAECQEQSQTPG